METSMLGAGEIMRELVLALGAAMVVGSGAVVVREWRRKPGEKRPRPNMKFVLLNILLGAVMAAWGLSSIIAAR
jgi:drug/metabolite transporter (DMT)-like permease